MKKKPATKKPMKHDDAAQDMKMLKKKVKSRCMK